MTTRLHSSRILRRRSRRVREGGYIALLVALMLPILFGMAAFSIDIGRWYITGHKEQRAADAAALAGVTSLPGDQPGAFTVAQSFASQNGYTDGVASAVVTPKIAGRPTRLRVTIKKTVTNTFGKILGVPTTSITRTAVADYVGPVPMGSPCNEMGNDPEPGNGASSKTSANCAGQGQFWGSTGAPSSPKVNGDAYQDGICAAANSGCSVPPTNDDYDDSGHFYRVTLSAAVTNLKIEVFDPAYVDVGTTCDTNQLTAAAAIPAANAFVSNPSVRYATGSSSAYCTGDVHFAPNNNPVDISTKFTIRQRGNKTNDWDPLSWPIRSACNPAAYPGFSGDLGRALDKTKDNNIYLGGVFRTWNQICSINNAPAGDYLIQVNTNGLGADAGSGENNYALRAYSTSSNTAKDNISISAYNSMTIWANVPGANTLFHLARVPSSAAGQVLNVNLFDVGDAAAGSTGTIKVLPPSGSAVTFTNCTTTGPVSGTSPTCSIATDPVTFQGKWESIAVPIPAAYTCVDTDPTACWVLLSFTYNGGAQPKDVTSWTASIEGDPVRLVE